MTFLRGSPDSSHGSQPSTVAPEKATFHEEGDGLLRVGTTTYAIELII